jgi:ribosomal protein S1
MEQIVIELIKTTFKVGGTLLVAVIICLFLLGQFPNLKLLISTVLSWFGGLGKWVRRRSLETEIEGAMNSFSHSFNRNYSFELLPDCDVQWVTARNQGNILKPGKAIVKLSFSRDDHDLNFFNAAQAYVETGLLPEARPFLLPTTVKAIDLLMVRILILQGRRQALRIFNNKFGEQEEDAKAVFTKLAETDEKALFRQLFLPEMHLFGQTVSQKTPTREIAAETEKFVDWFYDLATRLTGEFTKLTFESENIKVGVILVADQETYDRYGLRPYLRRANLQASRDFHCIYVLSRGRRRADIAAKIVRELCESGGYSQLSKRTATIKRTGDDEVLITCIAIKPDITTIVFNAWQRLEQDFKAANVVTGTVEHITEDLLVADIYGIKFELDREHLSSIAIGPLFRFFERDQELELRILKCDATTQTAELTNCDTSTDPKALAELVEQNQGQLVQAHVERIVRSKDYEVGWDLLAKFGDRRVRAFLPRSKATFGRYVSLSDKIPISSIIQVVIERLDLGYGGLTCSFPELRDPWNPPPDLHVGSKVNVWVREVSENHATCEIEEGLEARLYYEEISWADHETNRQKIREMRVGEKLEAIILRFEPERRYISVSLKRLAKSSAEKFFDLHNDEVVDARIETIGRIGATVSFPGTDVFGRLHIRDIIWGYCDNVADCVREGVTIKVKCLRYDDSANVIQVGIKQLQQNHFEEFRKRYPLGSTIPCEVIGLSGQSIRVRVPFDGHQTFGYIHRSQASWRIFVDERTANHMFRKGEIYHCVVTRFDLDNQLVEFSRKQFLAAQLERNQYGVGFRARIVFANREVFAYGDLVEGRLIGRSDDRREPKGDVEVMLSRKGQTPRDVEVSIV